jgi:single-strand DNA-binding protein
MGKVIPMNGDGADKRSTRGPSMNQVVLCGRLIADPRVHVKADGLQVSEFRMVTNDRLEPEYHDVVTYRRLAELVGDYTRKGSLVLVQGHLHTDRWTAQDGGQRQRLIVIGESVQFLSRAPQTEEES